MPDGIGISSYLMRQQNGLSLKTQHNSKVWTIVPLEPPKPLAPGAWAAVLRRSVLLSPYTRNP
ncbi:protein of unknown function [Alcaligenes faecalis subsp. faecalis]|nr:protein of unknown function [Alcaligenes faecalis subsp. faecalis]